MELELRQSLGQVLLCSAGGALLRLPVSQVEIMKRRQMGRCLMKVQDTDHVISAVLMSSVDAEKDELTKPHSEECEGEAVVDEGRVFSTLRKPVWRANFAMAEYRGGDEAEARKEMDMRPEAIVSRLYLKVEYETLRRLPQNSQYLVFTIRPYMDPLPAWSRTPLACRALASEIRRLPEGVLDYKGLGEPQVCSATLAFFDAVCAASGVDVEEAMPAS
eukprot:symbB.v1.2.012524.t1/scaffold852.1/size193270/2